MKQLHANSPHLKLIVLSVHDEASACRAVLEAGADGFVLKRGIATDLLPAIDAVQAGRQYVSPAVTNRPVPRCTS